MTKKKSVMVDGLDASGKSIVISALKDWAMAHNLKPFDVREYFKEFNKFPSEEELNEADAILVDEPTRAYIGKAIREELIAKSSNYRYSAMSIAQAFALDREILYNRVVIPAIKAGKYVFQERGVVSSLVYQPVQEHIQLSELMHMPGNKLALQNAPGLLIILQVNPEEAARRISERTNTPSYIFETIQFQRNLDERYNSAWLKSLFEKCGSRVAYLDVYPPITEEDTKKVAIELFEQYLAEK